MNAGVTMDNGKWRAPKDECVIKVRIKKRKNTEGEWEEEDDEVGVKTEMFYYHFHPVFIWFCVCVSGGGGGVHHMENRLCLSVVLFNSYSASHDNWCTVGGNGECRVGEVRAGTTSPMPDHKGSKLQ